jgi:hypothetical protein
MRPVEYFLSHQNGDRADVVDLEGAMRRRGLASWRDRRSLLAGDDNDTAIRAGIDRDTSGFVIYGSDRVVSSWYVWNKEWPWAHERRERELATGHPAPYRIVPLLIDGLDYRLLRHAAADAGHADPTTHNGEVLRRGEAKERDAVARWLLHSALADRCATHTGPLAIRFTTFAGAGDVEADLLVDWSPEFAADPVDWPLLRASLRDLKDELAVVRRPIEIDVQSRLVSAFVFGHAFPLPSRTGIAAIHRDGSRWTIGRADPTKVAVLLAEDVDGDPAVAAVQVSLARAVRDSAAAAAQRLHLRPGPSARITFADGVDSVDAAVAGAAAASFGQALRGLRDAGVRQAHIFIAAPAALVLLLGASVNAGPAMTLYFTRNGEYEAALTLAG